MKMVLQTVQYLMQINRFGRKKLLARKIKKYVNNNKKKNKIYS